MLYIVLQTIATNFLLPFFGVIAWEDGCHYVGDFNFHLMGFKGSLVSRDSKVIHKFCSICSFWWSSTIGLIMRGLRCIVQVQVHYGYTLDSFCISLFQSNCVLVCVVPGIQHWLSGRCHCWEVFGKQMWLIPVSWTPLLLIYTMLTQCTIV